MYALRLSTLPATLCAYSPLSSLDLEIDDGGLGFPFGGPLRPFCIAPSVVLAPLVCPEETGGVSGVRPFGGGAPYGEAIG